MSLLFGHVKLEVFTKTKFGVHKLSVFSLYFIVHCFTMDNSSRIFSVESSETSRTESAIDIASPDATCRICLVEFHDPENKNQEGKGGQSKGKGQEWIQLACRCRGDLALAHLSCAIKWFSIKGTNTCDVCGAKVKNLPPLPPPPFPSPLHPPPPRHNRHGVMNASSVEGARTNVDGMEVDGSSNLVKIFMGIAVCVLYSSFFELLTALSDSTSGIGMSIALGFWVGIITTCQNASQTTPCYRWALVIFQFACVVILALILYYLKNFSVELAISVSSICGMALMKLINGCRFCQSMRARIRSNSNSNGANNGASDGASTNGTVIIPAMNPSQANAPPYSSGTVITAAGLVGSLPVFATNSSVNNRGVDQTW